jgi:hypothetical protein
LDELSDGIGLLFIDVCLLAIQVRELYSAFNLDKSTAKLVRVSDPRGQRSCPPPKRPPLNLYLINLIVAKRAGKIVLCYEHAICKSLIGGVQVCGNGDLAGVCRGACIWGDFTRILTIPMLLPAYGMRGIRKPAFSFFAMACTLSMRTFRRPGSRRQLLSE